MTLTTTNYGVGLTSAAIAAFAIHQAAKAIDEGRKNIQLTDQQIQQLVQITDANPKSMLFADLKGDLLTNCYNFALGKEPYNFIRMRDGRIRMNGRLLDDTTTVRAFTGFPYLLRLEKPGVIFGTSKETLPIRPAAVETLGVDTIQLKRENVGIVKYLKDLRRKMEYIPYVYKQLCRAHLRACCRLQQARDNFSQWGDILERVVNQKENMPQSCRNFMDALKIKVWHPVRFDERQSGVVHIGEPLMQAVLTPHIDHGRRLPITLSLKWAYLVFDGPNSEWPDGESSSVVTLWQNDRMFQMRF